MSNKKWDVVVIGGGFSGLSVGALLANAGKKVLILEKDSILGARMRTAIYKGVVLDEGAHGFMMNGYTEEIFSRLGIEFPGFLTWKGMKVLHEGKFHEWADIIPGELRRMIKEEIMPRSYEELADLDDVTLKDWVTRTAKDQKVHNFFWPWGWLIGMGSTYEPISAGNVLISIKEQLEKRGNFNDVAGEIPGGFGVLIPSLTEAAKAKGVEIRTNARVCDVVFKDGKVRGVEVDSGEKILPAHFVDTEFIEADVVVSTAPLWDLFNIICEDDFPRWYVDWIKDLNRRYINLHTVYWAMEKIPESMIDDSTSWFISELPRTGLGATLAWYRTYGKSVGQHLACLWIQCDWFDNGGFDMSRINEPKIRREARKFFDDVDEDMKEFFPELERDCLWKTRHAARYSIAEVPGAIRMHRPGIEPPGVENFFLSTEMLREALPGGTQAAGRVILQCIDKVLGNK